MNCPRCGAEMIKCLDGWNCVASMGRCDGFIKED